MKTAAALAIIALGLTSAAQAGEPDAALPPAYIIHKLTSDGIHLRKLEAENGIYEARVEATDGSIVKVGIDPRTADLTDAYSHARARKPDGAAPGITAAEAIQAVAYRGHWNVREIEFERGVWQVAALDDAGNNEVFTVDAATGAVK